MHLITGLMRCRPVYLVTALQKCRMGRSCQCPLDPNLVENMLSCRCAPSQHFLDPDGRAVGPWLVSDTREGFDRRRMHRSACSHVPLSVSRPGRQRDPCCMNTEYRECSGTRSEVGTPPVDGSACGCLSLPASLSLPAQANLGFWNVPRLPATASQVRKS